MGLSGQQRKQLQEALIDAFPTTASLEQMLSFELDKNLRAIAGEGSLQNLAFILIGISDSQGWLEDLVLAACKSNPGNQLLKATAQELLSNQLETYPVRLSKTSIPKEATARSVLTTPPSRLLTRQQFLKWAIPTGIGVVGVTVASQFPENQSQRHSPSQPIDYSVLERLLKTGRWKAADQQTTYLLLKVSGQETERTLDSNSIEKIPCEVLSKIDRLWVENSKAKFGFSIQRKIYEEECIGLENPWLCFGDQVGWLANHGSWIDLSDVAFKIQAPNGHLPVLAALDMQDCWSLSVGMGLRCGYLAFLSRAGNCKL